MDRGEMLKLADYLANALSRLAFILNDPLVDAHKENLRKWIAALRASAAPEEGIDADIDAAVADILLTGGKNTTLHIPRAALSPDSRKAEPMIDMMNFCSNCRTPNACLLDEAAGVARSDCTRWVKCSGLRLELEKLRTALTPATEDGGRETITFPRWWVERCRDQLFSMKQLPSGELGDWAFLFREMLSDALSPSPSVGTGTADHLRQIKAFASTINERNFLDIALHIARQADQALSISSADRKAEA